jgi:hypothetical protein
MEEHFKMHPAWKAESEERIMSARDCLERYVMNRIAAFAFKSVESKEEDDELLRRMQLLSFIGPEVSLHHTNLYTVRCTRAYIGPWLMGKICHRCLIRRWI